MEDTLTNTLQGNPSTKNNRFIKWGVVVKGHNKKTGKI
jgi:hypothetical protein